MYFLIYLNMIKKLFKNKFFASTFILLTGGFLSKFLGFILRIIISRYLGTEGLGLYSLLMPTFSLFIVIATLSFPIAISKLVAIPKRSSKKVIFSIIPVSLLFNIITIIILFIISRPLATIFLKEERLIYPIICIGFTLPFIGLSSIIKGYFWGKQRMLPYILSNISEQILRLTILIICIPKCIEISVELTISVIILVNILSESFSVIVMLLGLPKGVKIQKEDIKPNKRDIKDVLNISVPSTSSKVVGSLSHFFEPIILTNVLLYVGYSKNFILTEYGIINGYVLGLLLIPQFFTQSISTALIPELSKYFYIGNKKKCITRIKQIVSLSLLIGLVSTIIIYLFPNYFLNLIYNTNLGVNYIKVLAPFMLMYFIDMPLSNSLQALDKSKESMYITIGSSVIKLLIIFITSFFKIGMYSLIISIIVSLLFSTLCYIKTIKKVLY